MTVSEPITRRKLYQEVVDKLLERISKGEFSIGSHLPSERELMAFYVVGRPTIREALQTLAGYGIVEIAHGERAKVVTPTAELLVAQISKGTEHLMRVEPKMLEHMKEARIFLVCGVARLAAERATSKDIVKLRNRLKQHRAALDNLDEFLTGDLAFHRELANIAGNPIYPALVEAMFNWASQYYQSIVRAPGAEKITLSEHEAIVEAIAKHDPNKAERAMRDHLTRASSGYFSTGFTSHPTQSGSKRQRTSGPVSTSP
jgi:GntR family transcriptional regulator, sialic acid-inducible nan operon repressor